MLQRKFAALALLLAVADATPFDNNLVYRSPLGDMPEVRSLKLPSFKLITSTPSSARVRYECDREAGLDQASNSSWRQI
jgi:hypothetical protein